MPRLGIFSLQVAFLKGIARRISMWWGHGRISYKLAAFADFCMSYISESSCVTTKEALVANSPCFFSIDE